MVYLSPKLVHFRRQLSDKKETIFQQFSNSSRGGKDLIALPPSDDANDKWSAKAARNDVNTNGSVGKFVRLTGG